MSMVELVDGGPEEVVEGQEVEDVSELTVASVDEGGREDEDVEDEEAKLGGGVGGMTKDCWVGGVFEELGKEIPSSGREMSS